CDGNKLTELLSTPKHSPKIFNDIRLHGWIQAAFLFLAPGRCSVNVLRSLEILCNLWERQAALMTERSTVHWYHSFSFCREPSSTSCSSWCVCALTSYYYYPFNKN